MRTASEFEEAYERVRRDVDRLALFITRDTDLAKDLLQHALVTAYRHRKKINSDSALKAYLRTALIRMYTRHRVVGDRMNNSLNVADLAFESAPSPEDLTELQLVLDAVDDLDVTLRVPFILAYVEGYSVAEISELLGVGLSAVKMRLARGREQVRQALGEAPPMESRKHHG